MELCENDGGQGDDGKHLTATDSMKMASKGLIFGKEMKRGRRERELEVAGRALGGRG